MTMRNDDTKPSTVMDPAEIPADKRPSLAEQATFRYEMHRLATCTTLSEYSRAVATFAASRESNTRLGNGAIGAGGELGELFDAMLATEFNYSKLVKEAGDYLWYLGETGRGAGLDIGELVKRPLKLDPRACAETHSARRDMLVVANGHLLDYLKKVLYHQGAHELDTEKLAGLLTSALHHFQWVAADYGLTLDHIAEENIKKLSARYTTGVFRPEDSRNRKEGDV